MSGSHPGPVPCSKGRMSTSQRSCTGVASVFLVRGGLPEAYCRTCRNAFLGAVLHGEVSREEYLRLLYVLEVMTS